MLVTLLKGFIDANFILSLRPWKIIWLRLILYHNTAPIYRYKAINSFMTLLKNTRDAPCKKISFDSDVYQKFV